MNDNNENNRARREAERLVTAWTTRHKTIWSMVCLAVGLVGVVLAAGGLTVAGILAGRVIVRVAEWAWTV